MLIRLICSAALVAGALAFSSLATVQAAEGDGIVKFKSAYPMPETIERMKKDIADKGIKFFDEIDQSKLAADAGITLLPSTLLVFGNPPLGTLFITSDPDAGLDWPVRLLVYQDAKGNVWVAYTDFAWIARRHAGLGGRPVSSQKRCIIHKASPLESHSPRCERKKPARVWRAGKRSRIRSARSPKPTQSRPWRMKAASRNQNRLYVYGPG